MQKNFAAGTRGQAVADLAMTKIGCWYSQDKRYQKGYYDCSSLVQRLYKEAGITLPATTAAQGEYCYKNAMIINKKQLKPGAWCLIRCGRTVLYFMSGRIKNLLTPYMTPPIIMTREVF